MSAERFVGRVGGLAVALGVGVAVASSQPLAWAEDGSPSDAESTSASSAAPGGTARETASSASTGTPESPDSPVAADSPATRAATPESASDDTSELDHSDSGNPGSTDTDPPTGPSADAEESSTKPSRTTSEIVDSSPPRLVSDSAAPATTAQKPNSHRQQRVDDSADRLGSGSNATKAVPKRPEILAPNQTPVDVAAEKRAVTQTVSAVSPLAAPVDPVAGVLSAGSAEPPLTVGAVVFTVLAAAGLGPLTSDDPAAPVDSALELAALAVATRLRTMEQPAVTRTASPLVAADSGPTVPAQPIGVPNPTTGVVTGTVIATDPNNNALIYTVVAGPTKGSVQLDPATGTYTYAATEVARLAAGATTTTDTDSFTVGVSDGRQTATTPVSVYVSPLQYVAQASIATGGGPSAVVVGADGRMYLANTASWSVSVINTATGQQVDANPSSSKDIAVGPWPGALMLSPDGRRLFVANTGWNTVSVFDTTTYKQLDADPNNIFSNDIAVGSSPSAMTIGSDGRLYVANRGSGSISVVDSTTYKRIDANPSNWFSNDITVGSAPSALVLNGTQLYVANRDSNTVSVIDTAGYRVTKTLTVGKQPSSMALGSNGRLYVADTGSNTVSIIDTATNAVGATPIAVGPAPSSIALGLSGNRAFVTNTNDTVSIIDTGTGTVIGTATIDTDSSGGHAIAVGPNGSPYVTDAADNVVRVLALARGNTAPVAGAPTVGAPDVDTGAVTVALTFTDPDGDTLTYSVVQPSTGTVGITGPGVYTFSPTEAARIAAATGGPTSTAFAVNATDGKATTPITVSVPVAKAAANTVVTVIGSVTVAGILNGNPSGQPPVSADRTRALIVTDVGHSSTRVAVVNTTTGAQIGNTLTLTGTTLTDRDTSYPPVISADGTRAVITATTTDWLFGTTTRVAVVNTTTGTQIGTTLVFSGEPSVNLALNADGTRVVLAARAYDAGAR